jgi:hypothetical protein
MFAERSDSNALSIEREFEGLPSGGVRAIQPVALELERNMASPQYLRGIVEAFSERIFVLRSVVGIDHLAFLERAGSEYSAIAMLSSIVMATGLPACVYRMTDLSEASAIAASIPSSDNKIAIIGSVILEEEIIINAARVIRAHTGAWSSGAVAFYGYGESSNLIETPEGPAIRFEIIESQDTGAVQSRHEFRTVREPGNSSLARGALRKMNELEDFPLGPTARSYTKDSLPVFTEEEYSIWQRLQENAKRREAAKGAGGSSGGPSTRPVSSIYEEIPSTRLLVEKKIPSIFGNR